MALCNLALRNLALCNLALCNLALCNLALCNLALCNLSGSARKNPSRCFREKTRRRLARKHFSTGAHPAAETPFYIAAASVSARGDAQCVWSHESSISSSYFPLELRRAISHESGLRKLHCSRLLRASCSLQAAARKCSVQVALRKCSAPVAPRKRFAHVLCASWSVQVALRLLCAVQVALRKLLCASDSAQVALRKCCRSCGGVLRVLRLYLKLAIFQPELQGCAPRTTFVLKSCDFPA